VRAAYAITFDLEVAREISHEAFMRFWERRDRLAPDSNEKAWLMRVAINLAISHRRGFLVGLRHRTLVTASADPARLALDRIEGAAMRQAMLSLDRRERAVLAMRYGRDLSFAEIGSLLQRPEGTVRTVCRRALHKLHRRLGGVQDGGDATTISDPVPVVNVQ